MKRPFWQIRIPTLLGLFIITVGVLATVILNRNGISFGIKANSSKTPTNVQISNITSNSFTVSYITIEETPGNLFYGTTNSTLDQKVIDDSDSPPGITPHKLHVITVKDLSPNTHYFFSISNGENTFLNNGQAYEIATATEIAEKPSQKRIIQGILLSETAESSLLALVYVTADNGQLLSTITKENGTFSFVISSMRTKDLGSLFALTDNALMQMVIMNTTHQSNISFLMKQAADFPPIILSQNYDFTLTSDPLPQTSTPLNFIPNAASNSAEIRIPKENDRFLDQNPTFKGNAKPNDNIDIIIHSEQEIKAKVSTDANGNWTYRPTTPLDPGEHTITVVTKDSFGRIKKETRIFFVSASGTQVIQSATPSATPRLSPTLAASPTLSQPTNTPTPTSIAAIPTTVVATPTTLPTPSPTLIAVMPTATPTKPIIPIVTGTDDPGSSSLLLSGVVALATTTAGATLFLLARGSGSNS